MDKLADARAVFEKLYKEQTVFIENTHGYDSQKFALWAGFQLGWKASRESLINNLPESINCPTAPELIWLQVDPEPEEENKPVYPVNLRSDDVTWCADRIHPTDTLYIRADLIQK
ncbi:hypothetical protein GWJ05_01295 [Proteus sp. G2626]|uniref:hypothetical protein n=1 Tax=Proteus sp. G2626 TaxID=2698842 RepID=UPI00137833D0|nr:hypothetical protein [Proteus sp. G2626]NBN44428.1 hypothetical protein [Proteus sp. G2626]